MWEFGAPAAGRASRALLGHLGRHAEDDPAADTCRPPSAHSSLLGNALGSLRNAGLCMIAEGSRSSSTMGDRGRSGWSLECRVAGVQFGMLSLCTGQHGASCKLLVCVGCLDFGERTAQERARRCSGCTVQAFGNRSGKGCRQAEII